MNFSTYIHIYKPFKRVFKDEYPTCIILPIKAKMFNQTSTLDQSLKNTYLIVSCSRRKPKETSAIVSEEVAILTCGLLIAVIAILTLIVTQAISAVTWGTATIWQLLNGKGLFQDGDEL